MLNLTKFIILFALLVTNIVFAQPKSIQLEYNITRNGKDFAKVTESFTQADGKYHILSTTKGVGLYALFGERVLKSEGEITAEGLKPSRFELKRGDNKRKSLAADFDWVSNKLNMLVKGKARITTLVPGTQDLASYVYQFMYTQPTEDIKLSLTTGKKLKQYTYKVVANDVEINAGDVEYKTLHLARVQSSKKKGKKELWLATSDHYIPIRYLVVEKNGTELVQTLTKISVK